jgi:hypothetical protein
MAVKIKFKSDLITLISRNLFEQVLVVRAYSDLNGVVVGYADCYSKGSRGKSWSFSEGLALD